MKKILLIFLLVTVVSMPFVSCKAGTNQSHTPESGENQGGGENTTQNEFTPEEKALFSTFGFEIPYISNNGYTISDCSEESGKESIHLCASVESQETFDSYRALYTKYEYHGTKTDDNGISHHTYYVDGFYIEAFFSPDENGGRVDVCVRVDDNGSGKNPTENENGDCDVEFGV